MTREEFKKLAHEMVEEGWKKDNKNCKTKDEVFIWMICYVRALYILDGYSARDMAELLVLGIPPCNTVEAAEKILDEWYDNSGDNQEDLQYDIDEMKEFWEE
jgi:hypothetical protein